MDSRWGENLKKHTDALKWQERKYTIASSDHWRDSVLFCRCLNSLVYSRLKEGKKQ